MKKLVIFILCLLTFQAYSQESFVQMSKSARFEQIEFEKINQRAKEALFPKTKLNRQKLKDVSIPVTSITSSQFSRSGDLNVSAGLGYLAGDFGQTNNPAIQIRGVYTINERYKAKTVKELIEGTIPGLTAARIEEDVNIDNVIYEVSEAKLSLEGSYVLPYQVGEYLEEFTDGKYAKLEYKQGMPNDY